MLIAVDSYSFTFFHYQKYSLWLEFFESHVYLLTININLNK